MNRPRTLWLARITGAPVWRDHTGGPWRARARRWLAHTILRYGGETCDACGGKVGGSWWVEGDADWRLVYAHLLGYEPASTPWGVSGGLLCPNCFSQAAAELRIAVPATLGLRQAAIMAEGPE